MIDNAKGADLVVHEAFNTVSQLMSRSGYDERMARGIGTIAHTAPSEVGHVFAQIAAAPCGDLSFLQRFRHRGRDGARCAQGWHGPLSLAQDLMVFNVTKTTYWSAWR